MPTVIEVASGLFICTTLVLCMMRLIQKWSWGKVIMTMCLVLITVFFGGHITVENIVKIGPVIWNFAKTFGLKVIVIIIAIIFLVQLAGLIGRFFHSKVWKILVVNLSVFMDWFAKLHACCNACVKVLRTMAQWMKVAFQSFNAIDDEDSIEEAAEKVRANYLRGFVYDIFDYWAAGLCALMISYMTDYEFSFVMKTTAMWVLDIGFVIVALVGCWSTEQDLTLGQAHRRAADGLMRIDVRAMWCYKLIHHPIALLWDGPEQLAVFYEKELKTKKRMILLAVSISFFQGLFWTVIYTAGHNAFIAKVIAIFD